MRFLLINPYYPITENPSPPLGLAFLAAALERAGVEVKILDYVVNPYSRAGLEEDLKRFSPDIAGLTCVTMNYDYAARIVRDIKAIDPEIITVMGGPHVTFYAAGTMEALPELDLIGLGEGDETIVELAQAARQGRDWSKIPGLVYRDGAGIHSTGMRVKRADVNSLPLPARHLLPLGRYRALGMAVSMTSSRGCPFQCIFCVGRKMVGARVRFRKPEAVVDEFQYLKTLNFRQINIADDLFTANREHCLGVCEEIIRRGLQSPWTAFARVDRISREILDKMKEAGCVMVGFGVESANEEILKTIKKNITTDQVLQAIEMTRAAGIDPHASFILGLPGETPETLKETLAFAEKITAMGGYYGFHMLAPFPGTEVFEESERYGLRILTRDWSQYHANRSVVETASADRAMMDAVVIGWEERLDKLLRAFMDRMREGTANAAEIAQIRGLERLVIIYDLMMKRLIEERGGWVDGPAGLTAAEALPMLADRLRGGLDYADELVLDALRFVSEKHNLIFSRVNGLVRFSWADYL